MSFAGYDNWKLASPPEYEEAGDWSEFEPEERLPIDEEAEEERRQMKREPLQLDPPERPPRSGWEGRLEAAVRPHRETWPPIAAWTNYRRVRMNRVMPGLFDFAATYPAGRFTYAFDVFAACSHSPGCTVVSTRLCGSCGHAACAQHDCIPF